MTERHFRLNGGTSDKVWAISVVGASHTVRFGRAGSYGQAKTKTFSDPAAARVAADKLIGQKTGKGYVEFG